MLGRRSHEEEIKVINIKPLRVSRKCAEDGDKKNLTVPNAVFSFFQFVKCLNNDREGSFYYFLQSQKLHFLSV